VQRSLTCGQDPASPGLSALIGRWKIGAGDFPAIRLRSLTCGQDPASPVLLAPISR
jgi:hypothetical protein